MYHLNEGDAPLISVGFVVSTPYPPHAHAHSYKCCYSNTLTHNVVTLQVALDYANPHLNPFKEFQVCNNYTTSTP